MSSNNKEIRAKELFEKGLNAFNKNNFTEALHYFNLSNKFKSDMTTFEYINRCKIKMNQKIKKIHKMKQKTKIIIIMKQIIMKIIIIMIIIMKITITMKILMKWT